MHTLLQSVESGYPIGLTVFLYLGSLGILLHISLQGGYHCPSHCRVLLRPSTNTGKLSLILSASEYGLFFFRGPALGILSDDSCLPCGGRMLPCAHYSDLRVVAWLRPPTLPPLEMRCIVALVAPPSAFNLNNVKSFSQNWRVRVLFFLLVFIVYSPMRRR